MKKETSLSLVNTFQRCRYLWHLNYVRAITPSRRTVPMALGSLVHAGLAAALANKNFTQAIRAIPVSTTLQAARNVSVDDFVVEESVNVEDLYQQAIQIASRAMIYLFSVGSWETVSIDGQPLIECRIVDGDFQGIVDWVARETGTNTIWLFDHKVRSHIQPDELEDYNVQMAVYQHLLQECGVDVVGSICFQIRSALPAIPKLNKDRSMSRADIASDWDTYRESLLQNGLNPADYVDMQLKLSDKTFFKLSKSYRSSALVQAIWDNSILTVMDEIAVVAKRYKHRVPPRNMHSVNCRLCSSRDFCQAELRGMDAEYLIQSGQFERGQNESKS